MTWIDRYGDRDSDGFQEYATRSSKGFYNQGWKDAHDAIPDEHGNRAGLPLALCELQGYAYDAKLRLGQIYEALGREEDAARLRAEAYRLFERFNDAFWWESEGTYYLGLDGDKQPIRTVASNPGHCLMSGIVPRERARRVAYRLLADDMWSGWGIRTLSAQHPAYNPFSYHTGTVWPHDNATIASGLTRYGLRTESARIALGLFEAAECLRGQPAARAVFRPAEDPRRLPGAVPGCERPPSLGSERDLSPRHRHVRHPRSPRAWAIADLPGSRPAGLAACAHAAADPRRNRAAFGALRTQRGRGAPQHDRLRGHRRSPAGA